MGQSTDAARYQELVRQLDEPWSRAAARQKLVAARAVRPLLQCLDSPKDLVVRAALQSLGELTAREAVGPLVELLEKGTLTLDVTQALSAITDQDFGSDAKKWRQWMGTTGEERPLRFDVADCVRRTGRQLGVDPSGSGNSYHFELSLPHGRRQKVAVYFGREDDAGDELVVVYSECGPAQAKYYEAVLRKNLSIPAGAFAIRDIDGEPHFVMVDTLVAASVTPDELAKTIKHIASRADKVEKGLTKEDRR